MKLTIVLAILLGIHACDSKGKIGPVHKKGSIPGSANKKTHVRTGIAGKKHIPVEEPHNATKKQELGIPSINGDSSEGLGGEPVGHLDGSHDGNGLQGLGGDMNGIPIGMGAGAEPLGLSKGKFVPNNMEDNGGALQGLDEEDRNQPSANKAFELLPESLRGQEDLTKPFASEGSDQQIGDFVEGRGNDARNGFSDNHGEEDLRMPENVKPSSLLADIHNKDDLHLPSDLKSSPLLSQAHANEDLTLQNDMKSQPLLTDGHPEEENKMPSSLLKSALSEQQDYDEQHGQMLGAPGLGAVGGELGAKINSIGEMDKVNIQGDGEVADMQHKAIAIADENVQTPFGQGISQMNQSIENKKHFFNPRMHNNTLGNGDVREEGYRLTNLSDLSAKRRLVKSKYRKHKFKKFRKLHQRR